jgi:hypothetical protein
LIKLILEDEKRYIYEEKEEKGEKKGRERRRKGRM